MLNTAARRQGVRIVHEPLTRSVSGAFCEVYNTLGFGFSSTSISWPWTRFTKSRPSDTTGSGRLCHVRTTAHAQPISKSVYSFISAPSQGSTVRITSTNRSGRISGIRRIRTPSSLMPALDAALDIGLDGCPGRIRRRPEQPLNDHHIANGGLQRHSHGPNPAHRLREPVRLHRVLVDRRKLDRPRARVPEA